MRITQFLMCLALLVAPTAHPESQAVAASLSLKPVRYRLELDFDFSSETLQAACDLTIRNQGRETITKVPLLLYRLLRVNSISDGSGRPLHFEQRVRSFSDWPVMQVNCSEVRLQLPLEPGSETMLRVEYSGFLKGYIETGMHYVRDSISPAFTIIRPDCRAYPEPGVAALAANSDG